MLGSQPHHCLTDSFPKVVLYKSSCSRSAPPFLLAFLCSLLYYLVACLLTCTLASILSLSHLIHSPSFAGFDCFNSASLPSVYGAKLLSQLCTSYKPADPLACVHVKQNSATTSSVSDSAFCASARYPFVPNVPSPNHSRLIASPTDPSAVAV